MTTTREHQDSPTGEFDTPFGPYKATVNSNAHIFIAPAAGGQVLVNRVDMQATMHLRNYGDGKGFVPDQGKQRQHHRWNALYTERQWNGGSFPEVSSAAKEKLLDTLPLLVNHWLAGQGDLLKQARRVELNNDILRKEGEAQEALNKLNDLNNELEELRGMEARVVWELRRMEARVV